VVCSRDKDLARVPSWHDRTLERELMEAAELAVIGASGDIGREIVAEVLRERVLPPTGRVQLVGRADGRGAGKLMGLVSDLTDAHAEVAPTLEVVFEPEQVTADVVVMAAGVTLAGSITSRAELAQTNLPIFHRYARALGEHGLGHEVVLVVSNPVELAVQVFSQYLDRHRVIGIGAHSDSLRFRRELASELGIRRQRVQGFVVGEHGDGLVPLWSSVRIHGLDADQHLEAVSGLRRGRSVMDFPDELAKHKHAVLACLQEGRVHEAFEWVDPLSPDLRVVLRPYVTQISGAKTAAATAAVTLDLVRMLLDGREEVVAGQVQLDGEFHDLHAPVGVPIVVSPQGWTRVVPLTLWPEELELLTRQTNQLLTNLHAWSVAG
jgi:malate dehydrogenase